MKNFYIYLFFLVLFGYILNAEFIHELISGKIPPQKSNQTIPLQLHSPEIRYGEKRDVEIKKQKNIEEERLQKNLEDDLRRQKKTDEYRIQRRKDEERRRN